MLTRRKLAAGLGLSLLAGEAAAQVVAEPVPAAAPPMAAQPLPEAPLMLLDAAMDPADRMTVEVLINGQGPFDFVVDTGADRSVVSLELAQRLGLPRGPDVIVHGVGGFGPAPTAAVALLKAGDTELRDSELPLLSTERLGGDGLLGVDILDGRNVVMDFRRRRLEVRRSPGRSTEFRRPREVTVHADARFGRLTVVDARIGGVRCVAFIDSGAGGSIGNAALARAINIRLRKKNPSMPVRLLGAAGEVTLGEFRVVRRVQMGDLRIENLPLVFADLHIFDLWNLNDKPAVLIGVDVLKMFARVELDFGGEQILFRLGKGGPPPVLNA